MNTLLEYGSTHLLSYADWGDPNGYPVLVQHGMIASIRDRGLFSGLLDAGVRLIGIARPGYGDSSPCELSNLAAWGGLVSVLVHRLKLSEFDLLGISSGAPYCYAIAQELPEHVRNIYVFSGVPALCHPDIRALWPHPVDPLASLPDLKRVAKQVFFKELSPEDLQRNDLRDSARNDCFGIAQDLKLRCGDWGFALSQVKTMVHMQHSRRDAQIPFRTAELTASLLPCCRLEVREDDGHFSAGLLEGFIRSTILKHVARPPERA